MTSIFSNLLEEAISFGKWLTGQLVKLNGENIELSVELSEQSASDEDRIIRFIRNHLDADHVQQYFKQENLKFQINKEPNRFKKLIQKHKIKSGVIYECESEISLRTSLDYTRRLLTVSF